MIVARAFKGKKYCVLGLARSGMAVVETLLASGAEVTVWDRREEPRRKLAGRTTIADPLEIPLVGYDAIIVSPGVPLNTHPIAEKARAAGVPVIGDIELFARARPELPAHSVIGITGTNGKSTTTALTYHLLQQAGVEARLGGNIGLPVLGEEPLGEGGVYVFELSSFQIDLTRGLACEAAALINISPDHLDRYDSFSDYAFAKGRLFAMQGSWQFAVFGCDDASTSAVQQAEASRRPESQAVCVDTGAWAEHQGDWPSLQGPHNLQNAAIAAALAESMGLTREQVLEGLATFGGLPHRMERLGECDGVLFVNDSKATNAASTAPALAAYPPEREGKPRIHWICGGLAKEDNLDDCEPHFRKVAKAYTIGEAGPMFAGLLEPHMKVERCELLAEAVRRAVDNAGAGDVILLSPACASFDQFRDYEARGEAFREIATELGCKNLSGVPAFDTRSAA
ncbi:UDP-N-acetylmuramoyl-L-alanine--D-glutamate ligase [Aurantiacibacter gangjinensis]|uniref:UDP-N-acetylmuramoylalanine--D-glutamate ligase n=1 Tax=Aurantiacibacter gangjinensis TaxID=502682 RepID=A0A0G9MRU5_9SPHN|nr:UDP-N-acetylmuramoyl-L-alanine--D-glutamate ligase [Aurantiacibacter gangjinensis]APE27009.1 UDP-N-acetylmuramoylalanine--D-glutamate ligase [Aurantiacibacter gangjinensis]KLE33452.1 UDP-N-acetylmuramoylalanine--D-glutamate ligase [Aurantiacibacter gangjinensis]